MDSASKVMSPKGLTKITKRSQKATRDESTSKASKGVVASSSAMAGEETVREARGEAAKDGKKQSRDEAKAKSQHDDAEEVHEPEADDVQSMFSPIEHEDDDEDQSAGQDGEDQSAGQDDEDEKGKPGWLPRWLPKSFGVYEAASDSGVKVRRPRSLPPQRSTTTNPKLKAKLKALERDDEEKGKVFTFSPGPSQVVSTKMQKLIEEEIRQRVDDELKKFGRIPKTTKSVSRKLFLSPNSEGEKRKMMMMQLSTKEGCRKPSKLTS